MGKKILGVVVVGVFNLVVLSFGAATFAFVVHILSRCAYLFFVATGLKREEKDHFFTKSLGFKKGYEDFKFPVLLLTINDALSFGVLCFVTRYSIEKISPLLLTGSGLLLIIVGGGIKLWAAETLGTNRTYWKDFFRPIIRQPVVKKGPYRFFRDPMYTVGYAQAYGVALMLMSWPALVAACFDQIGILLFNYFVERPHFEETELPKSGPALN